MFVGFDPSRVRLVASRLAHAIGDLDAVRSADPAAADALRAVRRCLDTLTAQWAPLVRDIERTAAMTGRDPAVPDIAGAGRLRTEWERTAGWLGSPGGTPAWITALSHSDLLAHVERLLDTGLPATERGRLDLTDEFWTTTFAPLATELARRAGDPAFAALLGDVAPTIPLVALTARATDLPAPVAAGMLTAMLQHVSWTDDFRTEVYVTGVEALMADLGREPALALDVLADPAALRTIADWPLLGDGATERFVRTGLYDAVAADPDRIVDGLGVLAELTTLTNGPLDGGVTPGTARGVAASLIGYVDVLGPAVRKEDDAPVTVYDPDRGWELTLGTYDELVDLFGALARDERAQLAAGAAMGAYTQHVVDALGVELAHHVGVEHVARLADLFGDAARSEEAEFAMAAAAEAARREGLGRLVGFLADNGLKAGDVTPVIVDVAETLAETLVGRPPTGGPGELIGPSIPHLTYDHITLVALALLARRPDVRAAEDVELDAADLRELQAGLDDVDAAGDDLTERARRLHRLERTIEVHHPDVGGFLRRVRAAEGVAELVEGRAPAGVD